MHSFGKLFCAAVLFGASSASAAQVSFDFTDNNQLVSNSGNTVVFESGGVTLTIGGYDFSGGINGTGSVGDATAWSNGVGLQSETRSDVHFVDGYYDEYLTLSFSTAVDVSGASFSYADHYDDWRFYSGTVGSEMFEDSGRMSGSGQGSSVFKTAIDSDGLGDAFLIGSAWNHSEWKLRGLTVQVPDAQVPPVPLPAAGWMLLAGVGGLAAWGRRRKSA